MMRVNPPGRRLPRTLRAFVLLAYSICVSAFVVAPVPQYIQTVSSSRLHRSSRSTLTANPAFVDAVYSELLSVEEALVSDHVVVRTRDKAMARMQESHRRADSRHASTTASEWRRLAGFSDPPPSSHAHMAAPARDTHPTMERLHYAKKRQQKSQVQSSRKTWHTMAFETQPRSSSTPKIKPRRPETTKSSFEKIEDSSVAVRSTKRANERRGTRQSTRLSESRPALNATHSPVVVSDRVRALRQQPKSPDEEARLAARYGAIEDLGERAFAILCDLEMIRISPNPREAGYDSSADHELAVENRYLN